MTDANVNKIYRKFISSMQTGFETTSTTITYALYEMAQNIEIQSKLREEIEGAWEGGLTYDTLMELKYLGKVVNETLRKYPIIPLTMRKSNSDYKVPGTMRVIPKGVTVMVPILAIHRDPKYYPDPNKFDPERFDDGNCASRPAYTFLPFSEGPRICIGQR
jgi:cytochrome P450 family 6